MAGDYGIRKWMWDQLDEGDFIDESTLDQAVAGIAASSSDGGGRWDAFTSVVPKWKSMNRPSGINFQTRLDEFIGGFEDIKKQIGKAKDFEDFPDIGSREAERKFGRERASEISELIAEKGSEFQTLDERVLEQFTTQIESATSLSELPSESTIGKEAHTFASEEELLNLLESKKEELVR